MLVTHYNMVFGEVFLPGLERLGIHLGAIFGRSFEHSGVKLCLVDLVDLGQKLPGPADGFLFKIVAEAPVSKHLEHRVVAAIVAHRFEVVVLTADSQAFLGISRSLGLRSRVAEENVFELVHSSVGEHKGRIILDDHRG